MGYLRVVGRWGRSLSIVLVYLSVMVLPAIGQPPPSDLGSTLLPLGNSATLPPLRAHPLPPSLAQWSSTKTGDYFDQIVLTEVEYLVWSQFPIRVYIDPPTQASDPSFRRSQIWVDAVRQAVQDWNRYLPLVEVAQPEDGEIQIRRSTPPLRISGEPGAPRPRARNAETRYDLYWQQMPGTDPVLVHRCTIYLRPNQAPPQALATARHELGHALGIWGHSPHPTDALYVSSVRNPPAISDRDINTLKRIYQQPTRLGWSIGEPGRK